MECWVRLQPVRPPWRRLLGRLLCVPLPSAPRALLRRGGLLSGGRPKITRSTHVCVFPQCRAFLDAFSLSHRSHELHGVPEEAGLLGASWSVRGRRRWLPGSSLSAGSQSCEPFPAVCVASVHVTAETVHRGPGNISCQGDGAGERAGRPLGARRTQGESQWQSRPRVRAHHGQTRPLRGRSCRSRFLLVQSPPVRMMVGEGARGRSVLA